MPGDVTTSDGRCRRAPQKKAPQGSGSTIPRVSQTPSESNATMGATKYTNPGDYTPIPGCLTAENSKDSFGKISRITNHCNEPLEAIWVNFNGYKNQITVAANNFYKGGDVVETLWACHKNDGGRLLPNGNAVCNH
jgi:hypothetical protein